MRSRGGWALGVLLSAVALAKSAPVFEVTRVSAVGIRYGTGPSLTPESVSFEAPLPAVIAFAYGVPLERVDRQPQWMSQEAFRVVVLTPGPVTLAEQRLLLQELLEEKFGLVVHRLTQDGPVYFMRAGPSMNLTASTQGAVDRLLQDREQLPYLSSVRDEVTPTLFGVRPASMSDLAAWLSEQVKRPVIDKTGISGLFDIAIVPSFGRDPDGFMSSVQQALGLKFEAGLGPVETLIIDRAEEPR